MTGQRDIPEKCEGVEHLSASARYSAQGLVRLWREAAFRQEIVAAALVLVAHGLLGSRVEVWLAQGVLILLLLAVEALNTAVEVIVDHVSPDYSESARHAKDLGSLAVLFLLLANGLCLFASVADWIRGG
ncbi:diacylglycerol kinase [Consotaella salsifontis]|uniref:Diacylglycerol kinase n=1 Tax=Consotaella salsifontis TaxID=1365950 RepID=A0A1T4SD98_9HYPH|nr:diacylglycerol kinase [Consotaella salsifontis]SKA26203.1 diacylglycerol kinase [Consotaella salsifontis]